MEDDKPMANLFTYGSLMFEPVWAATVGRTYGTGKGVLRGYAIYKVHNEVYPGIIKASHDDSVTGLIYYDIGANVLQTLDRFEGDYYYRDTVEVDVGSSRKESCHAYLVKSEYFYILDCEKWHAEWFEQHGLKRFLASYIGFNDAD
jgi:gamma-glutamylcyclotransferase (GGCT)/AIG2-like uncharacterized protein YtfP